MYQNHLLADKIALVTGGRSGIGYAIAKQFLQLGATVIIASRKAKPLAEAAKELSEFGNCDHHPCDIRKMEEVSDLATYIKENHGQLDILINNAGGQFPSPAEYISPNGWAAVINNNLNGTFYVSQQMAKTFFIPQKSGIIVNIIANMFRGFPGMAHTGAARAGVENLTKTLALEWSQYNIRVNAIAPGTIESSGLDTYPQQVQDFFEEGKKDNPLRRFGTVEEVSNAVTFFASPLASYINGTTLYVDGAEHLGADRMGLFKVMQKMINQ
ncbi:MAG: SDR family oxidoreductase [Saprospiraceae bacterium]